MRRACIQVLTLYILCFISEHNRRAKFYQLMPAGRKQLVVEQSHWARLSGAVNRVLLTENAWRR